MTLQIKAILGLSTAIILFCAYTYVGYLRSEIKILTTERNQAEANYSRCQSDQKLTSEVSNEYQNKLGDLNKQLTTLRRLYNNPVCVPTPRAPGSNDGAPGAREPIGAHGILAGDLLEFAGESEKYRLQLISCQEFIRKTWAR